MFAKLLMRMREKHAHNREMRRVKRIINRLVAPTLANEALSEACTFRGLKEGQIEFVVGLVRGNTAADTSARIKQVAEVADSQGAAVEFIGPLLVLTTGAFPGWASRQNGWPSLVLALREQVGNDIKFVYGVALGHHGLMGTDRRVFRYSFILPHFDEVLKELGGIQFGECKEVLSSHGQQVVRENAG